MIYRPAVLVVCHVVLLSAASVNQAEEPRILPRAGVLVLRNGAVLQGEILRVGDRYVVALNKRDEVAVPADTVDMQCDSLKDAYRRKAELLPLDASVAQHLELADWCLQNNLLAAAAEQLMAAQRWNPSDPANEHFEKRLRLAARQQPGPATTRLPASEVGSRAELDELVRSLPASTVERFTETVQPLLINHCGASACHGMNADNSFRLMSPSRNGPLPRRFTQKNLQAVLEYVDPEQPGHSRLLQMATEAHGRAREPALTDRDVTQLHYLAEWVLQSTRDSQEEPPAVFQAPDSIALQPLDTCGAAPTESTVAADERGKAGYSQPPCPPGADDVQPAGHVEPLRKTDTKDNYSGVDPFDPEIFNRRYLK